MANPIQAYVQSTTTARSAGPERVGAVLKSGQTELKAQLNRSIVEASVEVSISAKDEPMQLLYTSVLDQLNELLNSQLGERAIQNAVSADNSPEGTARRIVGLSTGFFEAFKARHAGEDKSEMLNRFMDTIRSGIDQGFKEAREVLQGLSVLQGDIASNIDQTYSLVQRKLDDFLSRMLAPAEAAQLKG